MEELQKAFTALVGPKFGGVLGAFILVLVLIPYIYRAWETWLDARSGKLVRELERSRYEVLKLRYEIEALRKEHDLPEFPDQHIEQKHSSSSPSTAVKPTDAVKTQTEVLKARPLPTIVLMFGLILFSILAVAALLGVFIALLGGIILSHDYGMGTVMLGFCLAILFATFLGIRRISRQLARARLVRGNKVPV